MTLTNDQQYNQALYVLENKEFLNNVGTREATILDLSHSDVELYTKNSGNKLFPSDINFGDIDIDYAIYLSVLGINGMCFDDIKNKVDMIVCSRYETSDDMKLSFFNVLKDVRCVITEDNYYNFAVYVDTEDDAKLIKKLYAMELLKNE